jgi:hypothetical protein
MEKKMSIICGYVLYGADQREKAKFRYMYNNWKSGWIAGGGWDGRQTLEDAFQVAQTSTKPSGCSWYNFGYLMAKEGKK